MKLFCESFFPYFTEFNASKIDAKSGHSIYYHEASLKKPSIICVKCRHFVTGVLHGDHGGFGRAVCHPGIPGPVAVLRRQQGSGVPGCGSAVPDWMRRLQLLIHRQRQYI